MPKVISTTLGRYRVEAVTIMLDVAKAEGNIHEIVGMEIAATRFRQDGTKHDQLAMNIFNHLTPQQKSSIQNAIQSLIQTVKQAEDVQ